MKRLLVPLAMLLVVVFIIAGCGSKPTTPAVPVATTPVTTAPVTTTAPATLQPQSGGILKTVLTMTMANFGYMPTSPGSMTFPIYGCMEGFIWHNGITGEFGPWLVESWDETPDQTSLVFHLRKGVKFHDGTPFNAQATKDYIQLKQKDSPGWLGNVKSIDIIDDYTVKLNTTHYDIVMFAQLSEYIASPTHLAKGLEATQFHPVGTGPFKFVEFKRDVHLKFTRFDDYWGGKPYLDGMEFIFVPDATTRLATLLAKEVDHSRAVLHKDLTTIKAAGYDLVSLPQTLFGLAPDSANPDSVYADKRVREAVEYAINREQIAKSLGYGYWAAMDTIYPPQVPGYLPGLGRKYDVAKAKQLLTEAGYPNGFETTIYSNPFANDDAIVAVQGYLAEVGIKARIDKTDMGRYTAIRNDWPKSSLLYVHGIFSSPYEYNLERAWGKAYKDYLKSTRPAGWDDLLDKAKRELNTAARKPMQEELQRMNHEQVMFIPLCTWDQVDAVSPRIKDAGVYAEHATRWFWPEKTWMSK